MSALVEFLMKLPEPEPVRNAIPNLRCLCIPSAATLAKQLPDIGDSLSAQCAELARGATPEKCEHLSIQLTGAARHVMALREAVQREESK